MKKTLALFVLSFCIISGCTSHVTNHTQGAAPTNNEYSETNKPSETSLFNNFGAKSIESIEFSKYISSSSKAQPVLFRFITEPEDIKVVTNWIEGINNDTYELPSHFKNLYIVVFKFKDDSIQKKDTIAYALDENGNVFVKDFLFVPEVNMEEYNETNLATFIHKIGKEGWYRAEHLSFIAP